MLGLSKPVAASGSLRVLAALLGYPDQRLRGYLPEMHDVLRLEGALPRDRRAELHALIDSLALG
jgi:nitrate reductase delta subunit